MATLLEVSGLRVTFPLGKGVFPAVDGVSFEVGEGEAVALVGESGCGKSLTAFALFRLVPPPGVIAGGRILLKGRDVMGLSEAEMRSVRGRELAMVFQEPQAALNPVLTVGFQIAEGLLAHERISKKAATARARDLLELVAIPDPESRLKAYPHQLSGGMRQRAVIAMALACGPSVLVADEPTTALDVTVQAQVLDLLDGLREKFNMGVLLITHDLGVVARFASRMYVMYCGRVVEEGSVEAILGAPGHPYTQGLLRSVPRLAQRNRRLEGIPGTVPPPDRLPPGCAFVPRCPIALPACGDAVPELRGFPQGRKVRCLRYGEGGA
jgi:oligopeptide/dipeptide ABC transporter ATP-binding protein